MHQRSGQHLAEEEGGGGGGRSREEEEEEEEGARERASRAAHACRRWQKNGEGFRKWRLLGVLAGWLGTQGMYIYIRIYSDMYILCVYACVCTYIYIYM